MSLISISDIRRQTAAVWQEEALLRGTLAENLTFGLDGAVHARLEAVLRTCQLAEFVNDLPAGLESPVSEWGATLSGGQRQRIAIARALLRDTPILLLDEATSNIDVNTEADLMRDLFAAVRGKTVVFATHRIGTAQVADRILVIEAGRVAGEGTHESLMHGCATYRRMYGAAMQHPSDSSDLYAMESETIMARTS